MPRDLMTSSVDSVISPSSEQEISDLVRQAPSQQQTFALTGGGTHQPIGRPFKAKTRMAIHDLTGITLYEPREMVLSAQAGTPLSAIETILAEHHQILPFEYVDYRSVLGTTGEATLGGLVATHISGPRRIRLGALRDHVIGVRFVNGRGEIIKSGGRVMKNVTGLDLVKLMCGAYGTLGVLTEVTLKLLPAPKAFISLALDGLDDAQAIVALSKALGSPFEVSAAAHLPAGVMYNQAVTVMRLENWPDAIAHRTTALSQLCSSFGKVRLIEGEASLNLWRAIGNVMPFAADQQQAVWRVSTAPSRAAHVVRTIAHSRPIRHFYDWGGGLIWIATAQDQDCGAGVIRAALEGQGHATLLRASSEQRSAIDVFEPLSQAHHQLVERLKLSFDPHRLFNPHIMYRTI